MRSIPTLQQVLTDMGIQSRVRNFKTGRTVGGNAIRGGALQYLLRNQHYIGELNHKGRSWPGDHPSIVDQDIFDQVQSLLDENLKRHVTRKRTEQAFLASLLYDDRGNRMQRSWTIRNGKRSFYYVSKALMDKRRQDAGSVPRVNATEIDGLVREAIKERLHASTEGHSTKASQYDAIITIQTDAELRAHICSVVLQSDRITITIQNSNDSSIKTPTSNKSAATCNIDDDDRDKQDHRSDDETIITLPWQHRSPYRKYDIIPSAQNTSSQQRPMRAESHQKLICNLTKAHAWLNALISNPELTTSIIAEQENKSERSVRMILSLAFVAPDLIEAALARRLPRGFHTSRFTDMLVVWSAQRTVLGLQANAESETHNQNI